MPLNFTKTLQNVDYSTLAERAIKEISPHVGTGKDLENFQHLIISTVFINQFADEEKNLKQGIWVIFELQNPIPRKDVIDGKEVTLFIRQFSTFTELENIPFLKVEEKKRKDRMV